MIIRILNYSIVDIVWYDWYDEGGGMIIHSLSIDDIHSAILILVIIRLLILL